MPDALKEMLGPDAPDVSIEAVGFHYTKSWLHKIEMSLMMETDPSEILNEIIFCTRKARARLLWHLIIVKRRLSDLGPDPSSTALGRSWTPQARSMPPCEWLTGTKCVPSTLHEPAWCYGSPRLLWLYCVLCLG